MVRDIEIENVEAEEDLQEMEYNLQRLIVGVPEISIDELPRRYQSHTVGVLVCFGRILCRVTHVVICYHEHGD